MQPEKPLSTRKLKEGSSTNDHLISTLGESDKVNFFPRDNFYVGPWKPSICIGKFSVI